MKFEKKLVAMCAVFAMGMAACEVDDEEGTGDAGAGGAPIGGAAGGEPPPVGGEAPPTAPPEPKFDFSLEGTTLTLNIFEGADLGAFHFGLAETGADNGWYGEDCIPGIKNDLDVCHPVAADGTLTLTDVATVPEVVAGSKTLIDASFASKLTYVVVLDKDSDEPRCWTWGQSTAYYTAPPLRCSAAEPEAAPEAPAG
ncbi:MAG: hypothetical protein ACOYM9_24195, partial [Bradymonadia bacterium]